MEVARASRPLGRGHPARAFWAGAGRSRDSGRDAHATAAFLLLRRKPCRFGVTVDWGVMIYPRIDVLPPCRDVRRRPRGAKWQRFIFRFELWPFCRFY